MHPLTDKLVWLLAVIMGGVYLLPMGFDALLAIALAFLLLNSPELRLSARSLLRDPLFACALLLLCYLGLSVFWSEPLTLKTGVQLWLRLVFIIAFVVAVALCVGATSATMVLFSQAVTVCALLCGLVSITLFYLEPPEHERLQGLFRFDNPGRIGRMFAVAALFNLCLLHLGRGHWRWLAWAGLAVSCFAVALSGTRSAWLAALIGIVCYMLAGYRTNFARVFLVSLACVALVGMGLGYLLLDDPAALSRLFPRGDSFRLSIWQANLADIRNGHLWFGWGQLVDHWIEAEGYRFRGPHNMFLAMLGAGGIPALVMYCVVLVWTGMRLVKQLEQPAARLGLALFVAGIAAFLFNGDRIIDKVNFVWFVLWFPLAVALVAPAPAVTANPR